MKTVVVTGSTRGIGKGLAQEFLARGCRVVVSGRAQSSADAAAAELASGGDASLVRAVACDITDAAQLQSLWDTACDAFGQVDVWVNNAGMSIARKPLAESDAEALDQIVAVNLTGLLQANRVALRGMLAQGGGQIWNMEGFGSGNQVQPGMCAYGATKRAVNYINRSLQKEVAGTGVQVCTLSPGIVVTELLVGDYDTDSPEWEKAKKIFNILGDRVETVTPFLVDGILKAERSGAKVAWLTGGKAFARFMAAPFSSRDLFS
ncbi:SDR family oxidoreductase [Pseudohalioglobus sediminis]|uniref:SDR family oxidoreductase n=1 Tax=Pseudohalioglobus sediminis TaxID=2606449 RepID=A0A5B0X238_9GAMM|nr:SDR family oxidoreductase [Pseudohalioglobus sediminis]KAA1193410.1 SDR family oxidoreductase [Pseudohalioglobus sediminis]